MEIINIHSDSLTDDQKAFYQKIELIKRLQDELKKLSIEIPEAIRNYAKTIHPIAQKITELEKLRLIAIDEFCSDITLSKRELVLVEDYMSYEILFWIHKYGEDETLVSIFQKYAHMPFKEYVIDLYRERVQSDTEPSESENSGTSQENAFSRKQTAAERKRYKKKMEEELSRKKTIRSIYIDLIKAFHPDTEQDVEKKLEKEEISKKITEAYTNSDLFTLLKLETDYLEHNRNRLTGMKADSLQLYLSMLSNQQKDIEAALSAMKKENSVIYTEMCRPSAKPQKFLRRAKKEMNEMIEILKNQLFLLNDKDDSIRAHLLHDMERQLSKKDIDGLLEDMLF